MAKTGQKWLKNTPGDIHLLRMVTFWGGLFSSLFSPIAPKMGFLFGSKMAKFQILTLTKVLFRAIREKSEANRPALQKKRKRKKWSF